MGKKKRDSDEVQVPEDSLIVLISEAPEPGVAEQSVEVEEQEAPVAAPVVEKPTGRSLTLSAEIIRRIKSGEFRPSGAYSVIVVPDEVIDAESQKNFVMLLLTNAVASTGYVDAPISVESLPSVKSKRREHVEDGRVHVYRERA